MRKRKCRGVELGEEEQIGPFLMLTLNTEPHITCCRGVSVDSGTRDYYVPYSICSLLILINA